jgi:hypothetical protein
MYGKNLFVVETSLNEEIIENEGLICIALASIFAASARVIGLLGRKVPSSYPVIHPFFTAYVIYSAYHSFLFTSGNPESIPVY